MPDALHQADVLILAPDSLHLADAIVTFQGLLPKGDIEVDAQIQDILSLEIVIDG